MNLMLRIETLPRKYNKLERSWIKMSNIKDVNIYLKEVSAKVTSHDMANHSIFPTQTLSNSLCSPFSYLKSNSEIKFETILF